MILAHSMEETRIEAGGQSLEHLQDVVNRYCLSLTGSRWDAEDLAQDTWLKAIQTLKGLGHTNPEAFMLRIAKNTWIDQSRRRTVLSRILKREQPKVTMPDEGPLEIEAAFLALMRHLTPLQRAVFLLRDVCGYSIAETAEELGTTEGAIKAVLHRARLSLANVKDDLETGELRSPVEEDLKAFLRALASAYQSGEIARLVELVQRDVIEPAVAIGYIQNQLLRNSLTLRRIGNGPHSGANLQMAA